MVYAACGKSHTVVVLDSGESYAFGSNKLGQCGLGKVEKKAKDESDHFHELPKKVAVVEKAVSCACGSEFSCWVTSGGQLLTAGNPQYGVLGHGTDNEYNARDGSVKLAYEPQPTPKVIDAFVKAGSKVLKVAAGHSHCVAVDADGLCFTWGNGGFGRLGHKEQKDEFKPKPVTIPGGVSNHCPPDCLVAAGSTSSFVTAGGGVLYSWGKLKTNGDSTMSPKAYMELSGWKLRSFACGDKTFGTVSGTRNYASFAEDLQLTACCRVVHHHVGPRGLRRARLRAQGVSSVL